jgi:hypothetical protein
MALEKNQGMVNTVVSTTTTTTRTPTLMLTSLLWKTRMVIQDLNENKPISK